VLTSPVYNQLQTLQNGPDEVNQKAKQALLFIEKSRRPVQAVTGKVQVQSADETYLKWKEADQQGLLKSTLSANDSYESLTRRAGLAKPYEQMPLRNSESETGAIGTLSRKSISYAPAFGAIRGPNGSPILSGSTFQGSKAPLPSTPGLRNSFNSLYIDPQQDQDNGIPQSVDALFKAVIWRIHEDSGDFGDQTNYVLVTLDRPTQKWAKRFNVPCSRLDELKQAIDSNAAGTTNGGAEVEEKSKIEDPNISITKVNGIKEIYADEAGIPNQHHSTHLALAEKSVLNGAADEEEEIVFRPRNQRGSGQNTPPSTSSNRSSWGNGRVLSSAGPVTPQLRGTVSEVELENQDRSVLSPDTHGTARNTDHSHLVEAENATVSGKSSRSDRPRSPQTGRHPPRAPRELWRGGRGRFTTRSGSASPSRSFVSHRATSSGGRGTIAIPTTPMDPNSFGRGPVVANPMDVEYVVHSGAPRSAARGRGRLWHP
jgi:hypothetical protein